MLEFLLRESLVAAGLDSLVDVDSGGTSAEESGNPADPRTVEVLLRNGHTDWGGSRHQARRIERSWLAERDLILAADTGHLRSLRRLAGDDAPHVRLIRSFDPDAVASGALDVEDPWYGWDGSAFDRTYAQLSAAIPGIIDFIRSDMTSRT